MYLEYKFLRLEQADRDPAAHRVIRRGLLEGRLADAGPDLLLAMVEQIASGVSPNARSQVTIAFSTAPTRKVSASLS